MDLSGQTTLTLVPSTADGHYQELALYNSVKKNSMKSNSKSSEDTDAVYFDMQEDGLTNGCVEEGKTDETNIANTINKPNIIASWNDKTEQGEENRHEFLNMNKIEHESQKRGSRQFMYINHSWGSTTNSNYKYDNYEEQ